MIDGPESCGACKHFDPSPGTLGGYCDFAAGSDLRFHAFDDEGRPAHLLVAADFSCAMWSDAAQA